MPVGQGFGFERRGQCGHALGIESLVGIIGPRDVDFGGFGQERGGDVGGGRLGERSGAGV